MPDRRRVYLDTCCFIDMVKEDIGATLETGRKRDVWFSKQLLQATRDGELDVFTSVITIAECQHVDGQVTDQIKTILNRMLMSGQYVKLIQPTPFIAADAQNLRWSHGISLRGADALHVASALALKCEEFISTDGQITKIGNQQKLGLLGLRSCRASDTNCLPAKYQQLKLPGHDQSQTKTQH